MMNTFYYKQREVRGWGHDGSRGFTLVELIVSVAIFGIVAVVATGAFLKVIDANKRSQATKSVVNNLNFVMDSMSRELRVAKNYYCNSTGLTVFPIWEKKDGIAQIKSNKINRNTCVNGDTALSFLSSRMASISSLEPHIQCRLATSYRYQDNILYKAVQRSCTDPLVTYDQVTSTDDINITALGFYIRKVPNINKSNAVVFIRGVSGDKVTNQVTIDLQTTIAQRTAD